MLVHPRHAIRRGAELLVTGLTQQNMLDGDDGRREQDHPHIQPHMRPLLGFKSSASAAIVLDEMVHIMRKRQPNFAFNPNPSLAEQSKILDA
jgi:hypothetical protein